MRRKQILVLEGPSGLGKTEYLRALVAQDEVPELNAEAMVKPVLTGLDSTMHKLIFWYECLLQFVLNNRKFFQCPPAWIQLGFSPTGRDVYRVWLNDGVMAIGSDSWTGQLDSPSRASGRGWIVKNTFRIKLTSKMWID